MAIRDEIRQVKRERVLTEAEKLFYERGFTATSLDAIAESLSMTKPFVYGVFAKKADILAEIYLRIVNKTLTALDQARSLNSTPTRRLRYFVMLFTEVVIDNQAGVAVFFREEGALEPDKAAEINRLKSEFDNQLAALLEEGVQTGEFVIPDVRLAALAIGGMISWIYIWHKKDGRLNRLSIAEQMAEYALNIVEAKGPR
jgi:AcrR family transcriptional regulator